jgi:tetratricopeptide (TPR) repeat protein
MVLVNNEIFENVRLLFRNKQFHECLKKCYKMYNLAKNTKDKKMKNMILWFRSLYASKCYKAIGQLKIALRLANISYRYSNIPDEQINSLMAIGLCCKMLKRVKQADMYYSKAIIICDARDMRYYKALLLNNKGNNLNNVEYVKESIIILKEEHAQPGQRHPRGGCPGTPGGPRSAARARPGGGCPAHPGPCPV